MEQAEKFGQAVEGLNTTVEFVAGDQVFSKEFDPATYDYLMSQPTLRAAATNFDFAPEGAIPQFDFEMFNRVLTELYNDSFEKALGHISDLDPKYGQEIREQLYSVQNTWDAVSILSTELEGLTRNLTAADRGDLEEFMQAVEGNLHDLSNLGPIVTAADSIAEKLNSAVNIEVESDPLGGDYTRGLQLMTPGG